MWTFFLSASVLFISVAGECRQYEKMYYEELGCSPKNVGDDGCPTSYDCSSLKEKSDSKCHYKGKTYNEGEALDQSDDNCVAGCHCAQSFEENKLEFRCANVECPELFTGTPRPGCYRTYSHDKCCSIDEICDEQPIQKEAKPVCNYKDKVYQIGERFYPDEKPCLECICQNGFDGSLVEPFCQEIKCSLELHYARRISSGCIPVYFRENSCCPIGWRCPEDSDKLEGEAPSSPTEDKDSKSTADVCQFGNIVLQVGQRLSASSEWADTTCTCSVPPHPICVKHN